MISNEQYNGTVTLYTYIRVCVSSRLCAPPRTGTGHARDETSYYLQPSTANESRSPLPTHHTRPCACMRCSTSSDSVSMSHRLLTTTASPETTRSHVSAVPDRVRNGATMITKPKIPLTQCRIICLTRLKTGVRGDSTLPPLVIPPKFKLHATVFSYEREKCKGIEIKNLCIKKIARSCMCKIYKK